MFLTFFTELRAAGVPVALDEYLLLMRAMEADLAGGRVEDFYHLARAALVKDEIHYDRFDRVFGQVFKGLENAPGGLAAEIPDEWLKRLAERYLTEEEKRRIEVQGGRDRLLEVLRERLAEQRRRHEGGAKWIGTAGTSPFGAHGHNPEGIRFGEAGGERRAVKVWEERRYRDLDGERELGTRNMRIALRRLRRFAREGRPDELDLDGTIRATAHRGWLDLRMRPERRNTVKVLAFFDVGGSMDWHVRECEALFSAARAEFRTLRHVYFHNCLYESVWTDNRRRRTERIDTAHILRAYPPDTRVIVVGDAAISPYELTRPGGSVEHWNAEPGADWLARLLATFEKAVWLNPTPEAHWDATWSTRAVRQIFGGRMFPLTLEGIEAAMRLLAR